MYIIRQVTPDDLPKLPIIEQAAAMQFRTTPYPFIAEDDDLISAGIDLDHDYVWVVVDADD
jgi:hypothetical protein